MLDARGHGESGGRAMDFGWFGDADIAAATLTSASVPTYGRAAVATSGYTRYLLITAGTVPDEGHAAAYVATGAPDRVASWTVAGAGHTGGLARAPDEWATRVVSSHRDALC
jgi:hypothetical protein